MDLRSQIHHLVAEVGPLRDYAAVAAHREQGLWRILIEDDLVVEIELDEPAGLVVLSGTVGELPPGRDAAALHQLMLDFGGIWQHTGGVQLARDADGAYLALLRRAAAGLDRTQLAASIDRFADVVRAWRTIVANPIAAMADRGGTGFDPTLAESFIRG